jgi:hypothetical protein
LAFDSSLLFNTLLSSSDTPVVVSSQQLASKNLVHRAESLSAEMLCFCLKEVIFTLNPDKKIKVELIIRLVFI